METISIMASSTELIRDSFDEYLKAVRLREIDSKEDPENEPYRSRYAARDCLNNIKKKLESETHVKNGLSAELQLLVDAVSAHVEYYLGLVSTETEEISLAEESLLKCLKLCENREITQPYILTCMLAHNELGVLWSLRGDNKKAEEYLKRSAQLSQKYRNDVELPPHSGQDLFKLLLNQALENSNDINNWKKFEDALTHCVYYLAQAFTSIDEPAKAALCYELTLRRQLDCQEFDGIDWATSAATLSQFFITEKNFPAARHLLACATKVLDDHSCQVVIENGREEPNDALLRRKADIARCWAKYGHLLLTFSWNDLLKLGENFGELDLNVSEKGEGELERIKEVDVGFNVVGMGHQDPHRMFESLGATDIEKQITAEKVLDFSQARLVFLNAQKWLNQAKEYYTFEDHASDYIQITQEMSQLYKILAQFEPQDDRRCKMHKRRIDMLEAILNGVNPQYYLDFCRQVQFEVADTYSEIMDIKLSIMSNSPGMANSHLLLKVHTLAVKSINSFEIFLDTFKSDGKLPDEYPEMFVRPILLAHVFMGRLHSKRTSNDAKASVDHLRDSLRNYQYVVDYCTRHPEAVESIEHELAVTKEMVNLLPMKIEKITLEQLQM